VGEQSKLILDPGHGAFEGKDARTREAEKKRSWASYRMEK
jgi:hypothetical protein